ncbi:MAG: family 78 glycoside hydrolase catalytic domain, partial [Bacteroidota bacterium]
MKKLKIIFRIFINLVLVEAGYSQGKPINLSCEHLINPLGIDAVMPRLSWQVNDTRQGAKQTAYEIFIGTDSSKLISTGKIKSDSQLIVYRRRQLKPFTRYYWKIKTWDNSNKEHVSQNAFFETGMLSIQNWKGSWISDSRDIALKPAAYFRKSFRATKNIKSARAYIACAGLYELSINGRAIGDHRLDPMYTRFDRRTLYVTYDVTNELRNDENCIGVLLGNGWYNHQSTAVWYFHQAPWRSRPSFCMDLRITYDDESVETISTGKDWKTNLSPVIFNSIYTAEHYDARLEIPHWNEPEYNDSAWKEVIFRPMPSANIVSQAMVPIRDVEHIPAKSMRKFSDSCYVFDLGRNIAGVSEIKLTGEAGTVVKLKHGERLYPNGHVDQSNIDVHYRPTDNTDPFQTDIYIL